MGKIITVSKTGDGDFTTLTDAAVSLTDDSDTTIHIRNGMYREKLFLKGRNIRLIGEDSERTVISWQDGAYRDHADGEKVGTFRSYTMYLGGERAELSHLTVENTAGSGDTAGQAVAVYADADFTRMEDVRLISRQDTLFLAPLPPTPRTDPRSFRGPGENAPRTARKNYLKDCYIEGDVDFIFGGAEAAFFGCKLFSRCKGKMINGYVAAPSTLKEQRFGFLFHRCILTSDCPPDSVYLCRPWREYAMASFLECSFGGQIARDGWSLWSAGAGEEKTVRFSEYNNSGPGAAWDNRPPWVKKLSDEEAERIFSEIRALARM